MISLQEAGSLGEVVKGQAAFTATTQPAELNSPQLGAGSSPISQLCFKATQRPPLNY